MPQLVWLPGLVQLLAATFFTDWQAFGPTSIRTSCVSRLSKASCSGQSGVSLLLTELSLYAHLPAPDGSVWT
ncbi:MAG: hypothetical protein ABIP61_09905 [Burkholderiaceae bacterium]